MRFPGTSQKQHRGFASGLATWLCLATFAWVATCVAGCNKVPTFGELVGGDEEAEAEPAPVAAPPKAVAVAPRPKFEQPEPEPERQPPTPPTPEELVERFELVPSTGHTDAELASLAEDLGEERERIAEMDFAGSKITNQGVAEIGKFPAVRLLKLNGSLITGEGLEHLQNLSSLEVLSLSGTRVDSEGLQHIAQLVNLRELDISQTRVTDEGLQYLANLTNLEKLCFSNTSITAHGFLPLQKGGKLANLKHIEAKNSRFGNGMGQLKGMPALQYLDVGQAGVTDGSLAMLERSSNLRVLNLGFNQLSDQGLVHLKRCRSLEEVHLRQNKGVRGPGLEAFKNCKDLKTLVLSGTSVSNAYIEALKKHVPDVQVRL